MFSQSFKIRQLLPVALVIFNAAVFAYAQDTSGNKHNTRPEAVIPATSTANDKTSSTLYSYEFTQPAFVVRRILIEHDANGRGRIQFEKLNEETPVIETLELSPATTSRISTLWQTLGFLESTEDYQAGRQYPHLGTMRLKMEDGTRHRTAEFNWTNNKSASSLVDEYRRLGDQALLVFDISVARESQPLNTPKLMEQFEALHKRNGLSDAKQLLPLLKDISTDEHIPLIARNHALRLIKKIEK